MKPLFIAFFIYLLFAFSLPQVAPIRTLKDYYSHKPSLSFFPEKKEGLPLSTHERLTQFRPTKMYHGEQDEIQNDLHRLVLQRMKYPTHLVSSEEIQSVRTQRATLYDPLQRKTVWVKTLTNEDLRTLLVRSDVRKRLDLPPLPVYKPEATSIY